MPQSTDPRERLQQVGSELLDAIYGLRDSSDLLKQIKAAKNDPAAGEAMLKPKDDGGDSDFLVDFLKMVNLTAQRDKLLSEYVAIRTTLEAVDGPRPEVPNHEAD